MTNVQKNSNHVRSFSTEVSQQATLEISFMDLGENSTVTSVILITGIETKNPQYQHITDVVMKSWSLHQYCMTAMKGYLNLEREDDERYDEQEVTEEFTGIKLEHYERFFNNY